MPSAGRRRRTAAVAACALLPCIGLVALQSSPANGRVSAARAATVNPIVAENSLPGNRSWSIDVGQPAPVHDIDAYTSETSVAPGQDLHLHVTGARGIRYRVYIYRLGWYGGVGGREILCFPSCTRDEPVVPRPPIPAPNATTGY